MVHRTAEVAHALPNNIAGAVAKFASMVFIKSHIDQLAQSLKIHRKARKQRCLARKLAKKSKSRD